MKTGGHGVGVRRGSLLRLLALGLALLLGLLQGALSRGASCGHSSDGEAQPAVMAAWADLCAPTDDAAPPRAPRLSSGPCCFACGFEGVALPPAARGASMPIAPPEEPAAGEGRPFALAHAADGWRSSWSAQAPPHFS